MKFTEMDSKSGSVYLLKDYEVALGKGKYNVKQVNGKKLPGSLGSVPFCHILQTEVPGVKKVLEKYKEQTHQALAFISVDNMRQPNYDGIGIGLKANLMNELEAVLGKLTVKLEGKVFWNERNSDKTSTVVTSEEFSNHYTWSDDRVSGAYVFVFHRLHGGETAETGSQGNNWMAGKSSEMVMQLSFLLEWSPFGANPGDFARNLLADESGMDVILVSKDEEEVKCHSFAIQMYSPTFKEMFSSSSTRRLSLKHMSICGIKILLEYFYGVQTSLSEISSEIAVEMFQTAYQYNIAGLKMALRGLFLQKSADWYSPSTAVELYSFLKRAVRLQNCKILIEHLFHTMTKFMKEVILCDQFKQLGKQEAGDLLENLLRAKFCTKCVSSL